MSPSGRLFDALNDAQRAAVGAPLAPTLVLAGAGSGKTRVLTHRAAWLIDEVGVVPQGLLAVTFTNKAAAEMRGRIETLLGLPGAALWIGTFHGIAHRMLRRHWHEAGLPQHFQILDEDDQFRMVRKLLREQNLDEQRWAPRELQAFINREKDDGRRPRQLQEPGDPMRRELARLYDLYQRRCDRLGVVDFAELLLRCYELIRDRSPLAELYRQRFRHVLVDEFQDTNGIQYQWLRLICGESGLPFVVGDDDQSIYRWRGARVENMQHFRRDFGATVFRLEQNYRSTGIILAAANEVIRHNADRLGKELWTAEQGGDPVRLYAAFNDRDEADFVVERIREHARRGLPLAAAAVLYRSNAQSRIFEEALVAARIAYRVYGGLRFFERAEIKDALAYLRLTQSRSDDVSFERVVNLPARGIGPATLEQIRTTARERQLPLWDATLAVRPSLPTRAANALGNFVDLIDRLAREIAGFELHEQVRRAVEASGLRDHYAKERDLQGETRVENLDELVNAAAGFLPEPGDELPLLASFLAHASLEAGEAQADEGRDCVQLMTLHSAKGLEFPTVFLVGLEEGLFPSDRSAADPEKLPEERRLCYVGITRAMQRLYLSHAETRRVYGRTEHRAPSRFLAEIPASCVEEVRPRLSVSRPVYDPGAGRAEAHARLAAWSAAPRRLAAGEDLPLALGARVRHPKFGEGVVLRFEGNDEHRQVQVNFEGVGPKWLMYAYAKLEPVGGR